MGCNPSTQRSLAWPHLGLWAPSHLHRAFPALGIPRLSPSLRSRGLGCRALGKPPLVPGTPQNP